MGKYEHDLEEQQQRLIKVQVECGNLTNEKSEMEERYNEIAQELQKLYESMFTSTDELQTIAKALTKKTDLDDINMSQCIQIIADAVKNNEMKTNKLKSSLISVMSGYDDQMKAIKQIFRREHENWSHKIHKLQDNLSKLQ